MAEWNDRTHFAAHILVPRLAFGHFESRRLRWEGMQQFEEVWLDTKRFPRIWGDWKGLQGISRGLAESERIWTGLRFEEIWRDFQGSDRICRDLDRFEEIWKDVKRFEEIWKTREDFCLWQLFLKFARSATRQQSRGHALHNSSAKSFSLAQASPQTTRARAVWGKCPSYFALVLYASLIYYIFQGILRVGPPTQTSDHVQILHAHCCRRSISAWVRIWKALKGFGGIWRDSKGLEGIGRD